MTRPPDPEMRSPAVGSGRAKSQKSPKQQRTYTIPVDVQAFIVALLPFSFPFVCVLCGGSR
jgi:hypothetical protein